MSLVVAEAFSPVAVFSARTVAARTAAPLGSVTVPEMSPVIFCAKAGTLASNPKQTAMLKVNLDMGVPLLKVECSLMTGIL